MIPEDIAKKIDEWYVDNPRDEKVRSYIGASTIGDRCEAYLAFSLRGFPSDDPPPNIRRILELGHFIEDMVVRDLRRAGIAVENEGPDGKQFEYTALNSHIVCHVDGMIFDKKGKPSIAVEIKSMGEDWFKQAQKHGVRRSHLGYYDQMQLVMGLSKTKLALFAAMNKNRCTYYTEVVKFDPLIWNYLQDRAERVMVGDAKKIATDGGHPACTGCFKRGVCWEGKLPEVACRTCEHATPALSGGPKSWYCEKHNKLCTEPCEDYSVYKPFPRT